MQMAVLEGRAPYRRPLCPTEVAARRLEAAASTEIVSSLGGLWELKSYVNSIVLVVLCYA